MMAKKKVTAQAGEGNPALVTEENQRHCDQKQSDALLRDDAVNEPLKQQGRKQREKAATRNAHEAG